MKILFIRHSKTNADKNHSSLVWPLSPEGVELAQNLANSTYIKQCQVVYSSLQTKAIETAILLCKPNFIPMRTCAELTEASSITNGYITNFEEELTKWHLGNYRINKGETKEEALLRFNTAVATIIREEHDKDYIGIVAHGNVLAIYCQQFSHEDSLDIHKQLQMPDLALFDSDSQTFIATWGELSTN